MEAVLRTKDPRTKEPRRKAGRNEWEHRQRRGARGCAKVALGEDLLRRGLLLSAGGFVVALLGASVNLSAGAVGIAQGVVGYFLGARRLGAASGVLGTAAVFFMAAASTGIIPGVEPLGHGYN